MNVEQSKANQQNISNVKEFYNNSVVKQNTITDILNDITATENLDINVEKVFDFFLLLVFS